MASAPCVNPARATRRGKGGRVVLKAGFRFKKTTKKGAPCIEAVGTKPKAAKKAKKRTAKKAGRKTAAKKAGSSKPCPRGSFRVKKGKGKGKCRKLTGAAAAAAAGRPVGFMRKKGSSSKIAQAYNSGYSGLQRDRQAAAARAAAKQDAWMYEGG